MRPLQRCMAPPCSAPRLSCRTSGPSGLAPGHFCCRCCCCYCCSSCGACALGGGCRPLQRQLMHPLTPASSWPPAATSRRKKLELGNDRPAVVVRGLPPDMTSPEVKELFSAAGESRCCLRCWPQNFASCCCFSDGGGSCCVPGCRAQSKAPPPPAPLLFFAFLAVLTATGHHLQLPLVPARPNAAFRPRLSRAPNYPCRGLPHAQAPSSVFASCWMRRVVAGAWPL